MKEYKGYAVGDAVSLNAEMITRFEDKTRVFAVRVRACNYVGIIVDIDRRASVYVNNAGEHVGRPVYFDVLFGDHRYRMGPEALVKL
jgi:hypothetical protein